ncbi:MAG TPA: hypothetical protein VHC90_01330 [Bryobacteraceae bacterium]|nr:hypothetical protein [Bryobacteraceae bacterium]
MKLLKAASATFCIAATAMIFAPGVSAQSVDDNWTKVTFSGPVEIPGVHLKGYKVLPAGTYVFRLLDSQTNRHIVQIQNADQSKTYATIMAIPDTRVHLTDKTVITFSERPNGQPPALRTWFYPDAAWGEEFVYSKKEAKELAKANHASVPYSNDVNADKDVTEPIQAPSKAQTAQMENEAVGAYNENGEEEPLSAAVTTPPNESNNSSNNNNAQAAAAPAQTNQSGQMAQNTPPANSAPAPASSANNTNTRSSANNNELPQTAGDSGMLMLGGLLALGGALSVRFARSRA